MSRRSADIFSQFEHIHERVDQAYRQLIGRPGGRFCVPYIEPAIDVYSTDDEVVVLVEIAGISGEEVQLEIEGTSLLVKGERRPLPGRQGRLYSQMEIPHGVFQREITLPAEVSAEGASATYAGGILEIVLPRTGPSMSRRLRVVAR